MRRLLFSTHSHNAHQYKFSKIISLLNLPITTDFSEISPQANKFSTGKVEIPKELQRNTLQHAATRCNTLQHAATHGNTRQHTATHCNTLQHTHDEHDCLELLPAIGSPTRIRRMFPVFGGKACARELGTCGRNSQKSVAAKSTI